MGSEQFNHGDDSNKYKLFEGNFKEQSALLLTSPYVFISCAQIMERTLEVRSRPIKTAQDRVVNESWLNHRPFVTGQAVAFDSKRNFKILSSPEGIKKYTYLFSSQEGALTISDASYLALEAEEFSCKYTEFEHCRSDTKRGTKRNPLWLALANNDQHLLNEYVDLYFSRHLGPSIVTNFNAPANALQPLDLGIFFGVSLVAGTVNMDHQVRIMGVLESKILGEVHLKKQPSRLAFDKAKDYMCSFF